MPEIINNPADPQGVAAPLPNPLPNPLPLPLLHWVPRTHINPDIIQLLKELKELLLGDEQVSLVQL